MKRIPKVLVVEDTEHWRTKIFAKMLSSLGYHVQEAGTRIDASEILSKESFDLVILDIRLSEGDASNTEGMEILKEIRATKEPTSVIIVSGYATVQLTRDAFKTYNVFDFLEKDENFEPAKFITLAKDAVAEAMALKYHDEKSLIQTLLFDLGLTYEELRSIRSLDQDLEGLLQDIVNLWPLDQVSLGTAKLLETSEGKYLAQIVGWSEAIGKAIAVHIGSENTIRKESENYERQNLGDLLKSLKQEPLYKTRLGAIVYLLENARFERLQNFLEFYNDQDVSNIIKALDNLFWNSCAKVYIEKGIDKVKVNLSATYQSVISNIVAYWKEEQEKDKPYLAELDEEDRQTHLQKYKPFEFVQKQSFIFESAVGIVHGDLIGENIIVAPEAQTWLLGFYDTGLSDVMRTESDQNDNTAFQAYQAGKRNLLHDFATLEVSIRKTLIGIDLDEMKVFDQMLCEPKQLSELPQKVFDVDALNKAYKTITRLRELALEILADFEIDTNLYYTELFFQFLIAYLHTSDQTVKDQLWATITILTNRLDR